MGDLRKELVKQNPSVGKFDAVVLAHPTEGNLDPHSNTECRRRMLAGTLSVTDVVILYNNLGLEGSDRNDDATAFTPTTSGIAAATAAAAAAAVATLPADTSSNVAETKVDQPAVDQGRAAGDSYIEVIPNQLAAAPDGNGAGENEHAESTI